MGCGRGSDPSVWNAWIQQAQAQPQRLPGVDDSQLVNIAASVGARSTDWTLCFAVAAMVTRRMLYFRATPGDCGSGNLVLPGQTQATLFAAKGIGGAAAVDPEPISKGILTGLSAIFGGFGAHHAQAIKNEQDTNCSVATGYNQAITSIEQAVMQGVMSPDQGAALVSQVVAQLDPVLARIAKQCNVSCGARIALQALVKFNAELAMPLLAPQTNIPGITPFFAPEPVASPGAPGTSSSTGFNAPPSYQGASGFNPQPFSANNPGVGPTSFFPDTITPGEIIIIGGVAFVASEL